ncbi:uncharacterized protein LOC117180411 [Belonocnema kinseyi]|uniref:uncharacterized protein LOC117180411 n=1 Tax=Belonocnema kinseyi TaxID=2817044 RepID=UPI00143CE262|nr:uncharacterized protein LOC117180411 [Belonocnema kinseyi]
MCVKCLRFGHISIHCRFSARCRCCGFVEVHTEIRPCPNANGTLKCANCGGDHSLSYKKCPEFLFQRELRVLATKYKLPFKEAKSILRFDKGADYASSTPAQANSSPVFSFSMFPELNDAPTPSFSGPRLQHQQSNYTQTLATPTTPQLPKLPTQPRWKLAEVHPKSMQAPTGGHSHQSSRRGSNANSSYSYLPNNSRIPSLLPNGFALH